MAGDWIKMRVGLERDPRVIAMADYLSEQREFINWMTDPVRKSCQKSVYEHVTRYVTVRVTVASLLVTWGTANEIGERSGDDLLLRHATIDRLDEMAGIPGFGRALEHVQWAEQRKSEDGHNCVIFRKFLKNNVIAEDRSAKASALRMRKLRAKRAGIDPENVAQPLRHPLRHSDVTVRDREEKNREEKNRGVSKRKDEVPSSVPDNKPKHILSRRPRSRPGETASDGFSRLWDAYPSTRRRNKDNLADVWKKRKLDAKADLILPKLEEHKVSAQWKRGFIPLLATWINQSAWEQDLPPEVESESAEISFTPAPISDELHRLATSPLTDEERQVLAQVPAIAGDGRDSA